MHLDLSGQQKLAGKIFAVADGRKLVVQSRSWNLTGQALSVELGIDPVHLRISVIYLFLTILFSFSKVLNILEVILM